MYQITKTGEIVNLFSQAVRIAGAIGSEVTIVENGRRCWYPAPHVSSEKQRRYQEKLAAYKAQQQQKSA